MHLKKSLVFTLASVVIVAGLLTSRPDDSGPVPMEHVSRAAAAPSSLAPQQAAPKREPSPAPVEEAPLTVQVERLIATQNPENAYRAYRMLSECADFNKNNDRLTFDEAEIKNWKPGYLPGYRGMTESEKLHDTKFCSRMTERERQSRLDYLAVAAKAGLPGAVVAFAQEGPFGDRTALQTRPSDPLVQEWRTLAIAQLTSAAEDRGDLGAMLVLQDEYGSGSYLVEKNVLLMYRYGIALGLSYRDLAGAENEISRSFARESQMIATASGFSPEEAAAQVAEAKRIADNGRAQRKRAR